MCGIAGIYNHSSSAPVQPEQLLAMMHSLGHRGPDGQGHLIKNEIGLGHRRLSIIDLSDRGRQPMSTPDGRFHISYNGEVYNYLELRAKLQERGVRFRSDTDTEVILHWFALKGADSLHSLNGMFAFAIWDSQQKCLFLARDRMGIKPLYYAVTKNGFLFASEVKALLASGMISAEVDTSKIDKFMTFGYVPAQRTMFKGIHKLLPGHWLKVTPDDIKCECYWDVDVEIYMNRSVDATTEELRALITDSVQLRMRSDVPVGVFLSGGLDSSTVVSLLSETGVSGIQTFSVAYRNGADYDESAFAEIVAQKFNTNHRVLYVESSEFRDFIPQFVWQMDEPVVEAAAISLYFVAKLLKEHVTVALSGEGADELFAGYDIYRYMLLLERYRRMPERIRRNVLEPVLFLIGNDKIKKYLRFAKQPLEKRYVGVSLHETWYKDSIYKSDFRRTLADTPASSLSGLYERSRTWDDLSRMQYVDLKSWLVDDLLIKADKMTMANAVELRVPFLDHRVVEFAMTIPGNMKMRGSKVKWILKQTMKEHLPQKILSRKKVGFPTPLSQMFGNDLSSYVSDLLLSQRARNRGYFKGDSLERLVMEHNKGKVDHHKVLWQLIILEEWHRAFIDDSKEKRLTNQKYRTVV